MPSRTLRHCDVHAIVNVMKHLVARVVQEDARQRHRPRARERYNKRTCSLRSAQISCVPQSRKSRIPRCTACGKVGHNRRTCTSLTYEKRRRCTACGNAGHNRRTCTSLTHEKRRARPSRVRNASKYTTHTSCREKRTEHAQALLTQCVSQSREMQHHVTAMNTDERSDDVTTIVDRSEACSSTHADMTHAKCICNPQPRARKWTRDYSKQKKYKGKLMWRCTKCLKEWFSYPLQSYPIECYIR